MKVLHLLYDAPGNPWVGGGGAVRAREINRRLAARGIEVEQLSGAFPGASGGEVKPGYTVRHAGIRRPYPLSRLSYGLLAGTALRRGGYDVAVVDFSVYTPVPRPPTGAPVVAVVHHLTGPSAPDRWGGALGGWIARHEMRRVARFDPISAVSPATARTIREIVPPGTEVRLIENGVDPGIFSVRRQPEDLPFLLYLGRLDVYHKGLDLLVEAFARIAGSREKVELRIAGGGRDAEALRARVAACGTGEGIRLLGPVPEARKRELLAGATAVVMPSRMEGWGMVAAEAMAAGAPLLVSDAGSLPELVGDAALVVRAGNAEALAAGIGRILGDAALRERLSSAGRAAARERFDWEAITDRHLDLLHAAARTSAR